MKKIFLSILFFILIVLSACNKSSSVLPAELVQAKNDLIIPNELSSLDVLPTTIDDITIDWQSNTLNTLSPDYIIIQSSSEQNIELTATLSYQDYYDTKTFIVTIKAPNAIDYFTLLDASEDLEFSNYRVFENINIYENIGDINISWHSSDSTTLSTDGTVVRPIEGQENAVVVLTAYLEYNGIVIEKSFTFTVIALSVSVDYGEYYTGVDGLLGADLKAFLHDLIKDPTKILTYNELWDALSKSDEDPANSNNVILFYTGRSQAKSTHGGAIDEWNREHIFPRSHGNLEPTVANTDMHHIRPTDVSVNALRGNLDFDNGGSIVYDGSNPTDCLKDNDSFEPRDEVKGDVARMIFYMAVRYEGDDGVPDLEVNNWTGNGTTPFTGKLSILLLWNMQDLPDTFEKHRNDVIFSYQGNRNPFIDHPEFANLIWDNL